MRSAGRKRCLYVCSAVVGVPNHTLATCLSTTHTHASMLVLCPDMLACGTASGLDLSGLGTRFAQLQGLLELKDAHRP